MILEFPIARGILLAIRLMRPAPRVFLHHRRGTCHLLACLN